MKIDPLVSYFSKHLPLNEPEIAHLATVFKEKKLRPRQFLLQEGDVCRHNAFVVEGCLKMYMVDENGKAHNLQFAVEDWWLIDMASFYSDEPSRLYIEAIEPSTLLQINKEDQFELFTNYPKFNHIFRVLSENALISCQRRILNTISSTAEERYLDFIKRYPQLFNRISNVQIAAYLGVTPEFLSTIRKRLSNA